MIGQLKLKIDNLKFEIRNLEKKLEIWVGKIGEKWKLGKIENLEKCGNLEKFGNLEKIEIWKKIGKIETEN